MGHVQASGVTDAVTNTLKVFHDGSLVFIVSYLGCVNMSHELLNLIQSISLEAIKISRPVVIATYCVVRK